MPGCLPADNPVGAICQKRSQKIKAMAAKSGVGRMALCSPKHLNGPQSLKVVEGGSFSVTPEQESQDVYAGKVSSPQMARIVVYNDAAGS
jgi:hypothetical protein